MRDHDYSGWQMSTRCPKSGPNYGWSPRGALIWAQILEVKICHNCRKWFAEVAIFCVEGHIHRILGKAVYTTGRIDESHFTRLDFQGARIVSHIRVSQFGLAQFGYPYRGHLSVHLGVPGQNSSRFFADQIRLRTKKNFK